MSVRKMYQVGVTALKIAVIKSVFAHLEMFSVNADQDMSLVLTKELAFLFVRKLVFEESV
jgi:hypothetical protein